MESSFVCLNSYRVCLSSACTRPLDQIIFQPLLSAFLLVVVVVIAAGDIHLHELRNPELMQRRRALGTDLQTLSFWHKGLDYWQQLANLTKTVQFSSVQDGIYALGKAHMRSTPFLSFPRRCLWNSSRARVINNGDPVSSFLMKIVERFLFPRLSPPGDRWRDVLGFVPAGSVSSSSTLQIFFRGANRSWWLLCPQVYLLGRFEGEKTDTMFFSSKGTTSSSTISHRRCPQELLV